MRTFITSAFLGLIAIASGCCGSMACGPGFIDPCCVDPCAPYGPPPMLPGPSPFAMDHGRPAPLWGLGDCCPTAPIATTCAAPVTVGCAAPSYAGCVDSGCGGVGFAPRACPMRSVLRWMATPFMLPCRLAARAKHCGCSYASCDGCAACGPTVTPCPYCESPDMMSGEVVQPWTEVHEPPQLPPEEFVTPASPAPPVETEDILEPQAYLVPPQIIPVDEPVAPLPALPPIEASIPVDASTIEQVSWEQPAMWQPRGTQQ